MRFDMQKRFFKFSVVDFLLLTALTTITFGILTYLMSLAMVKPFLSFNSGNWITFVTYVLIIPTVQTFFNRNGELIITDPEQLGKCNDRLEEIIVSRGYISYKKGDNEIIYSKRTKIGRFFNFFLREDIVVRKETDLITVLSKRNTLIQIENKIKKLSNY